MTNRQFWRAVLILYPFPVLMLFGHLVVHSAVDAPRARLL
jgi:hypothetical protein